MADGWSALRRTPRLTDDHQTPAAGTQPGAGATDDPTPVSTDAGNGTGDLRAKLIEIATRRLVDDIEICAYEDVDVVDDRLSTVVGAIADAVLAAGWCPAPDTDVLIGHFVDFAATFQPTPEECP